MSEEQNNSTTETSKKQLERSASYPYVTILDAINFTSEIYKHYGLNNAVTREHIAIKLNKQAGSITRDVAAAVQYGFLAKDKEGYSVTSIFKDYTQPTSANEKKLILLRAFSSPKLYQELIVKYDGSIIPQELPNTLIRYHNIASNAAQHCADIFVKNGQYVEAIGDNRFLRFKDFLTATEKSGNNVDYEEIKDKTQPQQLPSIVETADLGKLSNERRIPIYLTKNKMAFLIYPSDISKNDIQILEHGVKGVLLTIELENSDDN